MYDRSGGRSRGGVFADEILCAVLRYSSFCRDRSRLSCPRRNPVEALLASSRSCLVSACRPTGAQGAQYPTANAAARSGLFQDRDCRNHPGIYSKRDETFRSAQLPMLAFYRLGFLLPAWYPNPSLYVRSVIVTDRHTRIFIYFDLAFFAVENLCAGPKPFMAIHGMPS